MEAINIVTVIAIILFARLGIRLVGMYRKSKKDENDSESVDSESVDSESVDSESVDSEKVKKK